MSRYSSANTLGPLSIARPDPSKIRPSISSDTPSFKLWPVNSTFVCRQVVSIPEDSDVQLDMPHLLHIDARCSLEDLIDTIRPGIFEIVRRCVSTWTTARCPTQYVVSSYS